MNITGDHRPISPSEHSRSQASTRRKAAETRPKRPRNTASMELHKPDDLRKAVERLIESGDVKAGTDGTVRESRVDQARENSDAGAYNSRDVLGQIVDRLLDQWKI